jgi:hypothetical protein
LRGGVGSGHFTFIFDGFTNFFSDAEDWEAFAAEIGQMQGRTAEIINRLYHNLAAMQEVRSYRRACHAFSEAFLKVVKYQLIVAPLVEIISAIGVGFAMF